MEKTFAWALGILLTGFVGVLAAYMKKVAENYATHEDSKKVLEKMKQITTAQKTIEFGISDEVWNRQRRWETRKEVLFEEWKNVGKAQSLLTDTITAVQKLEAASTAEARSAAEAEAIGDVNQCKDALKALTESVSLIFLVSGT